MLQYPVNLTRDSNGTVQVEAPDLPEVHTFGEDEDEAMMQAVDAIETALCVYIEDRRDIPPPSAAQRGMKLARLPALTEAKVGLYSAGRRVWERRNWRCASMAVCRKSTDF